MRACLSSAQKKIGMRLVLLMADNEMDFSQPVNAGIKIQLVHSSRLQSKHDYPDWCTDHPAGNSELHACICTHARRSIFLTIKPGVCCCKELKKR